MKQRLAINIRGHRHSWSFEFEGNPEFINEWREDGLDVVEVYNSIPEWMAGTRLARLWVFAQDVFKMRNPFR